VDLEHVGVGLTDVNTLVTAPRGVELERVGGGTFPHTTRETIWDLAA
jgi:hypothetical protein